MTGDVVAFGVHPLDDGWVNGTGIIDLAFPIVVGGNEESRFCRIRFQKIQDIACINVRTVIKGQGNSTGGCALVKASAAVRYAA